jgi:DNA mismatch repair protein MutS
MAIAQAVVEYLHHYVGARALFATHFHELAALARPLPRLRPFNVAAIEEAGRLVFLHRVRPGGSDRSYGVHVARLAGIPPLVAARAEELLRAGNRDGENREQGAGSRTGAEDGRAPALLSELAGIDVLRMSPLEAAARLQELQERAARLLGAGTVAGASETPGMEAGEAPVGVRVRCPAPLSQPRVT